MESFSEAFKKSGMDLNKVKEIVLKQETERIQEEIISSVTHLATYVPMLGIFERMQDLYMKEDTRNFIIHLIKAYLNPNVPVVILQHIRPDVMRCPICEAWLRTLSDIIEGALKYGTTYIKEHENSFINNKLMKAYIEDKVDRTKLGVGSPKSNRYICSPCYHALTRWMKWAYFEEKSDSMMRRLHWELRKKEGEDLCQKV